MTKSESKFYNTSIKMDKAFLSLLQEKELPDISIVELCEKAGVNRTTFYCHYKNTHELLQELLNRTTDKLYRVYKRKNLLQINNIETMSKQDVFFLTPKYLIPFLEFTKNNTSFFKVYIKNVSYFNVDKILDKYIKIFFSAIFKKFGVTDERTMKYRLNFYFLGILGIINEWVKHKCKDSTAEICKIIIDSIGYKEI